MGTKFNKNIKIKFNKINILVGYLPYFGTVVDYIILYRYFFCFSLPLLLL